jgi:hypothetical protein
VDTLVIPDVDSLRSEPNPSEQRFEELVARADDRVHGAVVVDVDMDVEKPRPGRERLAEVSDDSSVARSRDVWHGFEGQRHGWLV